MQTSLYGAMTGLHGAMTGLHGAMTPTIRSKWAAMNAHSLHFIRYAVNHNFIRAS